MDPIIYTGDYTEEMEAYVPVVSLPNGPKPNGLIELLRRVFKR